MTSKPRVKPTELKTVISLLEAEHPDVEQLAREVILELKSRWINEDYYAVLMYDPNSGQIYSFGPYLSKSQAEKSLGGLVSAGPIPSKGWVTKLYEVKDGS